MSVARTCRRDTVSLRICARAARSDLVTLEFSGSNVWLSPCDFAKSHASAWLARNFRRIPHTRAIFFGKSHTWRCFTKVSAKDRLSTRRSRRLERGFRAFYHQLRKKGGKRRIMCAFKFPGRSVTHTRCHYRAIHFVRDVSALK